MEQQVPVGYKPTEVGIVPVDWDVLEIQDFSKTGSGTTPARAQENRYFKGGETYWVKTTDLNNSVIRITEDKVTDLALKETCLQVYPIGTVLVAMYGGFNQIGRTGILSIPAAVNQALVAVQVNKKIDSRYLLNTLNYKVEYWKSVASSSRKDPNITSLDVKRFKVALPPTKEEQTAIANALSDVDTLITSLEKLISKKRAIKTAAIQQLLAGKKRLPPFDLAHTGYKQTELGEIPKDWELVQLGMVLDKIIGGGTPSRANSSYWSGNIPWVTVKDFATFNPTTSQEYITKLGLENSSSNLIPEGVLIISTRMALGKAVIYNVPVTINQDLKALFPRKIVDTKFLYYWFEDNVVQIDDLGSGSTVKGLSLLDLKALKFRLPSKHEQIAIANVLSDMDKEIDTLEQRINKTQQLKQGMTQELLTGRTRLI
ncbi:restriction endonuclease subunit S [Methylobacter sp.]|uniref:restriction endonuclease subunit S n=1 Tax=Methylobacter sp. TaxID=2051955 RepID=UPI003DA59268